MPHAFQIHKQDSAYFMTLTAVEWVDAFMRKEHKEILSNNLNHCVNEKGLEIFAYVIMSSSMHLIARAKNENLSDVMRDFKKYTSGVLLKDYRINKESRRDCLPALHHAGRAAGYF